MYPFSVDGNIDEREISEASSLRRFMEIENIH
jgi:hypothetical protein